MRKLLLCMLICLALPCYGQDIRAIKTNENFEEVARIDHVQEIRINKMPRRQYTPVNLRTQYEMRFTGKDDSTGAMTVWSNTFTDYDTYIKESILEDSGYYIIDNTGKRFKTGDNIAPLQDAINNVVNDLGTVQTQVNTNKNNIQTNKQNIEINRQNIQQNRVDINQNRQDIQRMNTTIQQHGQDIQRLDNKVDTLRNDMNSGLATVTALTSLHPNPRSTSPIELSIGTGIYRDQCAGAAGLFVHPSDNIMLQGGFAFGNQNNYAGYAGMTISLPWFKH